MVQFGLAWKINIKYNTIPGFYFIADKNLRKPQLGDRLMKAVRAIASNGVPYFEMSSVGSRNRSGREEIGKKERTGWEYIGWTESL